MRRIVAGEVPRQERARVPDPQTAGAMVDMPDRDADGFGAVHFRSRSAVARQQSPSLLAIGATVFLAVLLALCAHSVITWAVIAATPEPTAEDLRREMKKWEGLWAQAMPAPPPQLRPAPTPASPRMPRYVGPIEANAIGSDTACMSGRTAVRIPHGWRTTGQTCIETTE